MDRDGAVVCDFAAQRPTFGAWQVDCWLRLAAWSSLLLLIFLVTGTRTASASVCAEVKIEIAQELTLERQGFDAHLRINNGLEGLAIESVGIDVRFTDEDGNSVVATSDPDNVDAAFFIRLHSLSGIDSIDGNGTVEPTTTADVHWLIVPAPGSGGEVPTGKLYHVGAVLSYTLNAEPVVVDVAPDYIFVRPMPQLNLDYFLTRQVYADDPLTQAIEPAEPFTLGVRVRNNGEGTARSVRIDSAQPSIVENELGLLINFRIIGSTVNDQPATPSLLIGLGDIPPQGATVGRWEMVTNLSGEFTEFAAEFSHADVYGGALTSLVQTVLPHDLVHDVRVDLPGRDAVRDFLARDGDVLRVYESSGLDSLVTDRSGAATLYARPNEGPLAYFQLGAPATVGFFYARIPDPTAGTKRIVSALRSDGRVLSAPNVWSSKSRNENDEWEHFINLFDANTPGGYVIGLQEPPDDPRPPVCQFIPGRTTYEGYQLSFVVECSDPNGTIPALSAGHLPAGATFVDRNNGVGVFDWTPQIGQAGNYDILFAASDGEFETSQRVPITVCAAQDSDCDGMDDDWELDNFGNLNRDGGRDDDGDGASDLEEFRDGTDPFTPDVKLKLRAGLNLISVAIGLDPTRTAAELLAELGESAISISRLNGSTEPVDTVHLEEVDAPSTDFPIVPLEGYLLRMAEDHERIWTGETAVANSRLDVGLNLQGFNAIPLGYGAFELLETIGGAGIVASISRFNRETGRMEAATYDLEAAVGHDFPIVRGEAYLISVEQAVDQVVLP